MSDFDTMTLTYDYSWEKTGVYYEMLMHATKVKFSFGLAVITT